MDGFRFEFEMLIDSPSQTTILYESKSIIGSLVEKTTSIPVKTQAVVSNNRNLILCSLQLVLKMMK